MSGDYDTLVGHLVLERGLVTRDQLLECLKQTAAPDPASTGHTTRLTDLLVTRGYLKADQLEALRDEVGVLFRRESYEVLKREDGLLGQILVRQELLSEADLKDALAAQADEARDRPHAAPRLGEILIKRGACTFADLEGALKQQAQRVTLACLGCGATYGAPEFDPRKKYVCKKCSGSLVPAELTATKSDPAASTGAVPRGGKELPDEAARALKNPKAAFGRYALIKELGRGGVGAVYKAWDTGLNRMVAIKVLLVQRAADEIERFLREAQMAASLAHPNIIAVYDTGRHEGRHYIAMEYVDGEVLAGVRLPIRKACEVVKLVAEAVHAAHERGIIHRDLKPHNVMLDKKGSPHVMDFGLAKSLTAESAITATGTIIGTPSYMPPEQAEGKNRALDRRCDVYSLGAILFELVTGRPPFKGATPIATLKQVLHDDPTPPTQINASCPKDVETIVLKCLEKERERRYPTAAALAKDLQRFLAGEAISARPASAGSLLARKAKRYRAWIAAAALVVVLPVVGLVLAERSRASRAEAVDGHLRRAAAAFDQKKWADARAEYRAALALDGGLGEASQRVAVCERRLDEERRAAEQAKLDAAKEAEEKRKRDEAQRREFVQLVATGDASAAGQDWEAARVSWEKALTLAKSQSMPEASAVEAKLAQAKAKLEEIAERKRRELEAMSATEAERTKKLAAAQPEFDAGKRKLDSADRDLYRPGADLSKAQSLAGEAIAHFTRAIEIFPRHHEAFLLRGRARAMRFEAEAAAADFTKAIECLKSYGEAYWARGRLHLQLYVDAMTARGWRGFRTDQGPMEHLQKAAPDLAEAKRLGLGEEAQLAEAYIAYASGDLAQCIATCEEIVRRDTTKEEAHKLLGDAWYRTMLQGGDDMRDAMLKCLDAYNKAIALRVNYLDAYVMRGAVLHQAGRRDEAAEDFKRALAINPRSSWAHNALAIHYIHRRDDALAMDHLDKAVEYDPKAPRAWADRALLKFAKGDFAGAMADGDRAVEANPERAEAWYVRGGAKFRLGKLKEALPDLQKAVELGHPLKAQIEKTIEEIRGKLGD